MNEYVLSFVDDDDVYRQLTFRGVSENVAKALATGLAADYGHVTLTGTAPVPIDLGDGS